MGEEEFYFGCHIIGFGGSDADSAWLFAEECKRLAASRWSGVGTKRTVELLNFEEFVQWAVKHAMAAPKIPSEAELRAKVRLQAIQVSMIALSCLRWIACDSSDAR